ncbi:hypothetical protein CO670_15520 [Rhizobium sp. J15]|uniref:phage adaptor protein n=1 Tax=Rhizobium sp. J15 TaxID=2035450 RepID=UPI000BEA0AC4|nr:hypothetical protein [Rhizobium sp. J15]PDT15903.1 hypothetical protein CO670_15520 [Rhizobium sp. J15]
MSLLTVCQGVCKVVGLDEPDAIASSTDREYVEMFALANEMATRIARGYNWQLLARIHTLTGDGSTEDFDHPDDYDRMLVKSQVWSSSLETALSPIGSLDRWLELDIQAFDFVVNAWIIYGGQMHIKPAIASAVTAKFFYQSNLIVAPSAGSNKVEFTADTDNFRLDEQLLKLGMIWQFKANKGLSYAEDMVNYENLLARLCARDRGSRMLRIGPGRLPRDVKVAYPQSIDP